MYDNTSGNAQRLQPTPKPTEILYAIYFHDPRKYSILYSSTYPPHRWHTSTSYLFLTDGVTVPSPSPFPYTRQPISHAKQPAWLSVALRLGRWMHAVQPSFWGEALPKIHRVGLSIHPPKIHTAGAHPSLSQPMAICRSPTLGTVWGHCPSPTLPIPNLREAVEPWSHPPLWGSCGAIAHPHTGVYNRSNCRSPTMGVKTDGALPPPPPLRQYRRKPPLSYSWGCCLCKFVLKYSSVFIVRSLNGKSK